MPTTKYKRRTLSIDSQFERLQTQWKNGQSGSGAWFWHHFRPVLLTVQDGKELHLKCEHCGKLFSARNPSRTSLEHLKSGACNAFRRTAAYEEVKAATGQLARRKGRKGVKTETGVRRRRVEEEVEILEDTRDAASQALVNFFLEAGLPACLLTHPQLMEMCRLMGVTVPTPKVMLGHYVEARFAKIYEENEMRMKKAGLFQIGAEGWRGERLTVMLNFPDGPPAFLKTVELEGEEIDAMEILGSATEELDSIVDRRNCIGWVTDVRSADRQALAMAEERYPWMVHIPCQAFAVRSLMKDLIKHVKMVSETVEMCQRIVQCLNAHPSKLMALIHRDPKINFVDVKSVHPIVAGAMALDSIFRNRDTVQSAAAALDNVLLAEESDPVAAACVDMHFWDCVRAVHALLHPILMTLLDVEASQPYFSQMLDMWLNLQGVVAGWCDSHEDVSAGVMELFQKRYQKSYHPAMAAAFVLDPGFCAKHEGTSFLPDWEKLNPVHESDAAFVLKKLSAPNRSQRVMTELASWRLNGLPSEFGSVVSERTLMESSCLSKCVPMALRKTAWSSCLKDYEALAAVAHRLLSLKATAKGPVSAPLDSIPLSPATAFVLSKMQYIVNNSRLGSGRLVDEKLLDLDILSDPTPCSEVGSVPVYETSDMTDATPEAGRCSAVEGSQLYMQQLQLSSPQHLTSSVLRMTPPPLGTMPELPLDPSMQSASMPEAMTSQAEESYYMDTGADNAQTKSEETSVLDPKA